MRLSVRSWRALGLVVTVISLALTTGCSRGDRPELGRVRGTVFLDGQPLDGAIVYFSPESGGRVSQDMTDSQGQYDLVYIGSTLGAKTGTHKVRITTAYETVDDKGETVNKKELVPKRYNSEETELAAEVKAGSNDGIDFKLESK